MPHNYTIQTLHQLQFTKGTDSFQISIYHFFFFQKLQDFGSSLFNWNSTETVVVVLLLLLCCCCSVCNKFNLLQIEIGPFQWRKKHRPPPWNNLKDTFLLPVVGVPSSFWATIKRQFPFKKFLVPRIFLYHFCLPKSHGSHSTKLDDTSTEDPSIQDNSTRDDSIQDHSFNMVQPATIRTIHLRWFNLT